MDESTPPHPATRAAGLLPTLVVLVSFTVYAITLLSMEWMRGQDEVRPYFADIQDSPFLFAVNTTLSSGLQGIASVLFLVALHASRMRLAGPAYVRMAAVQVLFFAWTAADDRFLLHERLPPALEGIYWLALGGAYVLFLLLHRQCLQGRRAAVAQLILGGTFFGGMLVADLLMPVDARLRLSIEDLLKAAASLALAGFAWSYLKADLQLLVPARRSAQAHER